jgi:hypothetical protein
MDPIDTKEDASEPAKISPTSAASLPEEELRRSSSPPPHLVVKVGKPNQSNSSKSSGPDGDISANDILFGRGGGTNRHEGNIFFRDLVSEHQPKYIQARKSDKTMITKSIVAQVRDKGGRFLKEEEGKWVDVGDKKAAEKTSQALREGLSGRMRNLVKEGGVGLQQLKNIGYSIYEDEITRDGVQQRVELFERSMKNRQMHTQIDSQVSTDEDDRKPSAKR